ncbi:hypothetical protein [Oscillospiraceae bacterium]|nr:hypothetical protein [Oscillospiraceae bacterium]
MAKFLQDAKNNCIMQIDFQELAQNLPGSCSKTRNYGGEMPRTELL